MDCGGGQRKKLRVMQLFFFQKKKYLLKNLNEEVLNMVKWDPSLQRASRSLLITTIQTSQFNPM